VSARFRVLASRGLFATLGLLVVALAAPPASGHPFLHDRLVLLDRQIRETPGDPALYVSRGSLLLDERRPAEALRDFDRAAALDPSRDEVELLRSRACLALDDLGGAAAAAERFLARQPDSPAGWLQSARVDSALGRPTAAILAFDRFFALAPEAQPDLYLERAALVERSGDPRSAAEGLESGIERLGPLTSLLERVVELQLAAEDTESALTALDRLVASSPVAERWLVARAEVLLILGRAADAARDLTDARERLARRPVSRRSAPALLAVQSDLDRLSRRLFASDSQEISSP